MKGPRFFLVLAATLFAAPCLAQDYPTHPVKIIVPFGAGKIKVSGNPMRLGELMLLMDEFPRMFEIVEPKRMAVS